MRGIKMTEDYIFHDEDLHDQIIAMDNTLTKKATKFSVEEQRLFYITLASIKPDQKGNEIEIDKKIETYKQISEDKSIFEVWDKLIYLLKVHKMLLKDGIKVKLFGLLKWVVLGQDMSKQFKCL